MATAVRTRTPTPAPTHLVPAPRSSPELAVTRAPAAVPAREPAPAPVPRVRREVPDHRGAVVVAGLAVTGLLVLVTASLRFTGDAVPTTDPYAPTPAVVQGVR